ncbi:MAG: hypothetical protein NC830_03985, partial [Candidatus Omnitrophica bacterium]|nr:hypothetical protein [Candidatus Omnitrophota bacterium]
MPRIFEYDKAENFRTVLIKENEKYQVFRVEFPSAYPVGIPVCDKAWGLYFRANLPRKAVIIIHGISMVLTTKYFCRSLAKKGFSSFMLVMPYAPARIPKGRPLTGVPKHFDWPEIFKRGLI